MNIFGDSRMGIAISGDTDVIYDEWEQAWYLQRGWMVSEQYWDTKSEAVKAYQDDQVNWEEL